MIPVDIRILDRKNPPVLKFPDRCVNCGRPKRTVLPLKLNMGVEERGGAVLMEMSVPLCRECEQKERRITNVTLVPFVIGGLAAFVIAFIPVWLVTPAGTTAQTISFPLIAGTLAGIIAGLIGGTALEFASKIIFAPAYGRLLLKRPFTAISLFNDSEDVIGLSTRFTKDKHALKLIFENGEIGRKFISLNPQEK